MVFGDKRPHLVALLVPDDEFVAQWCRSAGRPRDLGALREDGAFRAALAQVVDRVNANLSPLEKVRRFAVLEEPFTVENGMMTPTMKIRRHKITAAYGEILDGLRSEEHTSELQSLMRISYAVFCLKNTKT